MTLVFRNVSFSYAQRRVVSSVSFHVGPGERACVVGSNGAGKTTLLQLATGDLAPESGEVLSNARPGVPVLADDSVSSYLQRSLAHLHDLAQRFQQATETMSPDYDALLAQMSAANVWDLPARQAETLGALGLAGLEARGVGKLSPGQQARLRLAALVLSQPEVLVLDEPTNHLDDRARGFLIDTLRRWDGPVLLVSHDRDFLDQVATVIYDLDVASWQALATARGSEPPRGVVRCAGNYSDYLVERAVAKQAHGEIHALQQEQKKQIHAHQASNDKIAVGGARLARADKQLRKQLLNQAQATAGKRQREDHRRLRNLTVTEVRKPRDYELSFPAYDVDLPEGLALSLRKTAVPGRLRPVTLDLAFGEHLLVTGPNGAGKSTLLRKIAALERNRVAFLPQELPQVGDPGFSPQVWEHGVGEQAAGILHPRWWSTPVSELSQGNQRRAQLAVALAARAEILILDEPTNYLDLVTLEALDRALAQWRGTLIVASHDQWLINNWRGRRLALSPV